MEDSFDKINIRIASFGQVLNQIILVDNKETLEKADNDTWQLDQYRACLEFDMFIQDYPKTYKKYINDFLISYTAIRMGFEKFLKLKDPFYSEKRKLFDIVYITIDFVIEHLKPLIGAKEELVDDKKNIYLRRPVAFCFCLLYKSGKLDLPKITGNSVRDEIRKKIKDKEGNPIASPARVWKTLCNHTLKTGEKINAKDRELFTYRAKEKNWIFRSDNFEKMIKDFPEEFEKAQEILNEL